MAVWAFFPGFHFLWWRSEQLGGFPAGSHAQAPVDVLEVWPESHWPGFALRQVDVLQSYTA